MPKLYRCALGRATYTELATGDIQTFVRPEANVVTLQIRGGRHAFNLELSLQDLLKIPGKATLGELSSTLTKEECETWMGLARKVWAETPDA